MLWWRDRPLGAAAGLTVGIVLVAGGLWTPRRLGPIRRGWMTLAALLARVTTPIVLGVVYFGIFTSVAVLRRWTSGGRRTRRGNPETSWENHAGDAAPSSMEHQF